MAATTCHRVATATSKMRAAATAASHVSAATTTASHVSATTTPTVALTGAGRHRSAHHRDRGSGH
jgi:hypothetical protein